MLQEKKDSIINSPDNLESKTNEIDDTSISNDNISVSQIVDEDNEEKDFYTFAERTPKELEFIWKPYLVKGAINIIQGEPGLGKSYLIAWLLSAISTGAKIPFSEEHFEIGNSIYQSAEDDIDATVLPRLLANGADVKRIGFINETKKAFSIQQLKRLEENIIKYNPSVVVLDPLQHYIGNTNMNVATEVSDALKPLIMLAQKYNCAIIIIGHLNKNEGGKASQRGLGSVSIVGTSRSTMLIAENPENEEERLFIPLKTNLMKEKEKRSLSYKINDNGILEWLEDKGKLNPDEVLNQNSFINDKSSLAKGFIIGVLSRGDISGNELEKLALTQGHLSLKTYNIIKSNLYKEKTVDKYQKDKQHYWTLLSNKNEERND